MMLCFRKSKVVFVDISKTTQTGVSIISLWYASFSRLIFVWFLLFSLQRQLESVVRAIDIAVAVFVSSTVIDVAVAVAPILLSLVVHPQQII